MNTARENRIQVSCRLRADPRQAFDVVYHVEQFPTFMPNVIEARVTLDEGDRKLVEWEMLIDDVPLNWTEEVRYDRERLTVEFAALDGAFSRFDGIWRVRSDAKGTELEVSVFYDLGLPEIEDIIGSVLDLRLRQNLKVMLESIEARVDLS
jgi:coenzyme Q-binding protein COQ10